MKKIMITFVISTFLSSNLKADIGLQIKGGLNSCVVRDGVSSFKQDNSLGVGYGWDIIKNAKNARKINYINENGGMIKNLLFLSYELPQTVNNTNSSQDTLSLPKSLIISDEEIKQAMEFGTKEKVTSIVMGAFWGFIIGASIGGSIAGEGLDVIGGVLYGGGAGLIIGPIVNYSIIYHLAKKEATKRLIESNNKRNSEGQLILEAEFLICCFQSPIKNIYQKNELYSGITLKVHL